MTFFQWRRFNFFDLTNNVDNGLVAEKLKDCKITCTASGRGQIVVGDDDGSLHFITCEYQVTSFKGYDLRVSHVLQMKQAGILVTIGEDEPGINPLIKVWNQEKLDKQRNPMCVKITRAIPGNRPTPATALAVQETLAHMAVGFADGSVVLYRGDITRNRSCKQEVLQEGGVAVTGLAFKTTPKATFLFVVTTDEVNSYNLSSRDKERKCHLDSQGGVLGSSVLADSTQEGHFMIGRTDAIYCYTPDGRGPCYAFDGEKLALQWFRGYLVIVSRDLKGGPKAAAAGTSVDAPETSKIMVTIFDTANKFVTFIAPMRDVMGVLPEWGSLCILSADKRLGCLTEKDLQSKLSLLFKKNLYDIAIRIAKSQQYDSEGLIDIFRQYGDHLYSKGDHNGAVEQYIKTIGRLEPSYVIRKFLDAQRIHNLTAYLQALHKRGLATEDHTTLLLNCYTKLKDTQKLDEFIADCEVDFDVETALKVCRQAGYFKHALTLAKKHKQHEWYLKIQIEDHKDYQEALQYISNLPFEEAEDNMKKYGSILLENAPDQCIELLKKLCTSYQPALQSSRPKYMDEFGSDSNRLVTQPEEFIHLFVNKSKNVAEFLEHMVKVDPNASPVIHNTLIEYHLQQYAQSKDEIDKSFHEEKVMKILQSPDSKYDTDQALVLCQMRHFSSGILYLYEKAKVYQHLLKYHIKNKDYSDVVATCKKFGEQDPNLWLQALWFISQEPDVPPSYLSEVLLAIEKHQLLSPLLVIDTLSNSSTATLGLVKDYLIKVLQAEEEMMAEDERLIQQYREETERIRKQIHNIRTNATLFQGSRCSACTHPLELPSVHFLCQHSYHQHCFESYSENESECPACSPENKKIQGIIRAQEQNKDLHEQFHSQLEKAEDGFSVLADYFGRGVFNRVRIVTDVPSSAKSLPPIPALWSSVPPTLSDPTSAKSIGPGAEARLRVAEHRSQAPLELTSESRIRTMEQPPIHPQSEQLWSSSEPRFRAGETAKEPSPQPLKMPLRVRESISYSLEHHISRIPDPVPAPPPVQVHSSSPKVPSRKQATIEENLTNNGVSNPFEDDYDETKNPFAEASERNPFEEEGEEDDYDKNLNPFA